MEYPEPQLLYNIISFILGLLFGSFATMASYRIPRGEDLVVKPSRCPKCNHRLGVFDLFPVLSWLINKGQCRHCKAKIHFRYPVIELVMASLFCSIYTHFGLTIATLILMMITVCLVISAVIFIEKRLA